ncbi:M43 family zinc metalloprotease [Cytophagaceae bacterium DM2B3-1]|uniref:M43 family zinc metalloprotease n=1 Tax=Xanthocytophaga flava TaxID=3048013 RepID=A0ABT7CV19_9BACT|nr:M43 family zinc metalloprotease [Xanthocytophaga flavus]MDJ1497613.1 M43 family zinc metalloprotease [Xanthocytophaga flavus]
MRSFLLFILIFLNFELASAQTDDGRLITIPVVFHVIYTDTLPDNGMSEEVKLSQNGNSTSRLPREKILAELRDLDQDFQQANLDIADVIPEFQPVIGNPRIHFVLRGIKYVPTTLSQIKQRNNAGKLHELSPIQLAESCLNVYVGTLRVNGGGSEGVTNVPYNNQLPLSDAVNLNYSWVGLGYRLLTHEVGHWLGLWHVDDKSQTEISRVTDIPVQNALTDIDCEICNRPGVKVLRSQRKQFSSPNTNNYMDYSGCRRMFSLQQSNYMRNIIITLRRGIWNASISKDK